MYLKISTLVFILLCLNAISFYSDHYYESYYSKQPFHVELYDLGHLCLPNLEKYEYLINYVTLGSLFLLCIFFSSYLFEFIKLYTIIFLLRLLFTNCTVLPKMKHCKVSDIMSVNGYCYDKIFSGHASFVCLFTLFLLQSKYISLGTMIILNLLNGLLIVSTKAHYTIDVLIAFMVTIIIFENKKCLV